MFFRFPWNSLKPVFLFKLDKVRLAPHKLYSMHPFYISNFDIFYVVFISLNNMVLFGTFTR